MAENPKAQDEIYLHGTPVSDGIVIGTARRVSTIDLDSLISFQYEVHEINTEVKRFENALSQSVMQIIRLGEDAPKVITDIFTAQLHIIQDSSNVFPIIKQIKVCHKNCESIIAEQLMQIQDQFDTLDNDILRARILDIKDVYHRVLANLLEIDHVRTNPLKDIPAGTVLLSEHLLPSDIVNLNTENIASIVTETGSSVSHVAILARMLHIPYVVGIKGVATVIRTNATVIVDGNNGIVIVNPSEDTVKRLTNNKPIFIEKRKLFTKCVTVGGAEIHLQANISSPEDIVPSFINGAEGIGLFRTEFFYLKQKIMPSIEQETQYYRQVLSECSGKSCCIRLFDFGGDKLPVFPLPGHISRNSFGNRGIRYLLENGDLFNRQLTCIASAYNQTGVAFDILIPFVTTIDELCKAKSVIENSFNFHNIDRNVYRLGMMVEVPSAFFALERLLLYVDFISVGTNDLTQYTFAFDRDEQIGDLPKNEITTILIETIRSAAYTCLKKKKLLCICGELASDPEVVPLLLQAGVRCFSVNGGSLVNVRAIIEEYCSL